MVRVVSFGWLSGWWLCSGLLLFVPGMTMSISFGFVWSASLWGWLSLMVTAVVVTPRDCCIQTRLVA